MTGRDIFMMLAGGALTAALIWIVSQVAIYRLEKRQISRRW